MYEASGIRTRVPKESKMLTFILLAVFATIGVTFFMVAYTANQRRRAGQSGFAAVHHQQVTRPRGSTPGL